MNRTRLPGPVQESAQIGNSADLLRDGASRWISVDPLSAGWTLNDPGSTGTINGASVDANGVRFQLEADNNSERWNNSNQHGPRYYKKLEGAYGPLTWGDSFSIEFLVHRHAVGANSGSGNQDDSGFVIGIADSTCTADTSDVEWVGCGFYNNKSNESVALQVGGDTGTTNLSGAQIRRGYVWVGPALDDSDADGHPMIHKAAVLGIDADGRLRDSADPAQQTHEYVSTDEVYIFVAPTFKSSKSGIADTDTTWKIWFRVNQAVDGLSPSYVPNGGVST